MEHRHPCDRRAGVVHGRRVDRVVGADDEHDIGVRQVVVDLVHLEHDVVGHLGLGEQDVHVPRETTGDRVDPEADIHAAVAQPTRELGHGILRLRRRHAVAGRDDDRPRFLEEGSHPGRLHLTVLAVVGVATRRRAGLHSEATGDDGDEGPVHRLAHDVGQVGTRGADQRTGDDEQVVVEQEAGRGCRPPRVGVEHRHDDRHVATADRRDQVPPEEEREHGHRAEQRLPHSHR